MKTYVVKGEEVKTEWVLMDAADKPLGRLASSIANILMGKDKVKFARNVIIGDEVIVINAAKVKLTGRKLEQKVYYRYSGYPGGIKAMTAGDMLNKYPERLILSAVKGMLPKNKLGSKMLTRLRVFRGEQHKHQAQQPKIKEV